MEKDLMKNIGNIIKTLQNIMRKDAGVSGDAQRIEQLGWMISLKILDDKDKELELINDKYVSVMPKKLQWRNWAADDEGMTGDELKEFVDGKLIPQLKNLDVSSGSKRALIIREIFDGTNNYMKNGTIIRQVINQLNQIDFNSSEDRHLFGDIYETILRDLQNAGPPAFIEIANHQEKEQVGTFRCAEILREIGFHAISHRCAKRGIGKNHLNAVFRSY